MESLKKLPQLALHGIPSLAGSEEESYAKIKITRIHPRPRAKGRPGARRTANGAHRVAASRGAPRSAAVGKREPSQTSSITQQLKDEKSQWSNRYETDGQFKAQIDAYFDERTEFIKLFEAEVLDVEAIEDGAARLGTRLAQAFGFIDENGRWKPEVSARVDEGGSQYARSSVWANTTQQLPGIARSVAVLGVLAADAAGAAVSSFRSHYMAGVNTVYLAWQAYTMCTVPFEQARMQSVDVARRAQLGPVFQPRIVASSLTTEEGNTAQLKGAAYYSKVLAKLEPFSALKVNASILKFSNRALKKLDRSYRGNSPDEIAKSLREVHKIQRLVDVVLPLAEVLGFKVEKPKPTKESLGQFFATVKGAAKQFPVDAPRKPLEERAKKVVSTLRRDQFMEQALGQLSHQVAQGASRQLRNIFNILTAGASLGSAAVGMMGADPWVQAMLQGVGLATHVAQVLSYRSTQTSMAAVDYRLLLTSQFKLIALTGLGNLAGEDAQLDPARLDKIVMGPLERTVDSFKKVLEFDRSDYRAAIWAKYVEVAPDAAQKHSYQSFVNDLTNYTLENKKSNAKDEFEKLGKNEKFLKDDLGLEIEVISNEFGSLLEMYNAIDLAINKLGQGKIDEALDGDFLTDESKELLRNAIKHAANPSSPEALSEVLVAASERLAELKGLTESQVDLGSVNQTAQKVAQQVSLYLAGPITPNLIKFIATAIQTVLYETQVLSPSQIGQAIRAISAGAGGISIVGSIVAIFVGYSYHENIATKERHRQRDQQRGASLPNAGISLSRALGFGNKKIRSYDTLLAKPIADKDRPALLDYQPQTTFWADVKEQIEAPQIKELLSYCRIEPARFVAMLESGDAQAISQQISELKSVIVDGPDLAQSRPGDLHAPGEQERVADHEDSAEWLSQSQSESDLDSDLDEEEDTSSEAPRGYESDQDLTAQLLADLRRVQRPQTVLDLIGLSELGWTPDDFAPHFDQAIWDTVLELLKDPDKVALLEYDNKRHLCYELVEQLLFKAHNEGIRKIDRLNALNDAFRAASAVKS